MAKSSRFMLEYLCCVLVKALGMYINGWPFCSNTLPMPVLLASHSTTIRSLGSKYGNVQAFLMYCLAELNALSYVQFQVNSVLFLDNPLNGRITSWVWQRVHEIVTSPYETVQLCLVTGWWHVNYGLDLLWICM